MASDVFARNDNTRPGKSALCKDPGCRNYIVGRNNGEVIAGVFDADVGDETRKPLGECSHDDS